MRTSRWLPNAAAAGIVLACAIGLLAAGSGDPARPSYDPQALPSGPVGESIAYGHAILTDTQATMKGYVRARMTCEACHLQGGTQARGGSFIGTFARFPQWNKRSQRVIALQDRLSECFMYSMNGKPPPYFSRETIALTAYIAWLSRGIPVGAKEDPQEKFIEPLPARSPDVAHGATLYAAKCAACHQADGNGVGMQFPPLWGPDSFNDGAGMAHIDRMTGFVLHNMPQNAPGSLSLDEAYDVAAYVIGHPRPHFNRNALVVTPPTPAGYF